MLISETCSFANEEHSPPFHAHSRGALLDFHNAGLKAWFEVKFFEAVPSVKRSRAGADQHIFAKPHLNKVRCDILSASRHQ